MTTYDPSVIQEFADKLYARANSIVASYTVLGALLGGAGGFAATQEVALSVAGVCFGGLLGFMAGREKAAALKLQAQTALCQIQIEENTRR